jgi:hypothetical protein
MTQPTDKPTPEDIVRWRALAERFARGESMAVVTLTDAFSDAVPRLCDALEAAERQTTLLAMRFAVLDDENAKLRAEVETLRGSLATVAIDALKRGDFTACAPMETRMHVHEVASGTGKPGTGLINERCRCGARRVADYRGMTGEMGEPKRSAWKGGKP